MQGCKKSGVSLTPVLFLHAYETRTTCIVADLEGDVVKVQGPLHLLWLILSWSMHDSQRLDVLWCMMFPPRLLLVTVVDVLRLHDLFIQLLIDLLVFQFFTKIISIYTLWSGQENIKNQSIVNVPVDFLRNNIVKEDF